ncbi:hypothetical protein T459_26055 [Capsicum annuum]|uniref:Protein kinase domain-containing protein n=1 Tax=Capsicum annuum TaxID=4072 RepID=A0A2G2YMY2_CAPAN|nr:hypothetical protein T459_26055 [Capsicum annuum]
MQRCRTSHQIAQVQHIKTIGVGKHGTRYKVFWDLKQDGKYSNKSTWKLIRERKPTDHNIAQVWDSVVRPSDYYMTHVSVHTNCSIVNELKDKFTKVQLDLFRNTCFGYFSYLPPVCIQNQLIHDMLLRKVLSSRSDKIWIQVNETKLQFGLSEFAVISGLKCTVDVTLACNLSQSSRLMNLYFPNQSKVTKLEMKKKFLGKKWQSDGDALHIVILYFVHSFLFSITYGDFINKDDFLLVESGQFETFPWEKLCFRDMLDSMKYQIYKQKSMYRRGGFSLAFQCWFYECCPYANDKLVVRVRDSVPRVLNWSVTVRSNYKKVKFSFSDIHREQVVLTNIESTCIEKSILQLPVFEPVPQKEHTAFKKSDGSSDTRKEHMREDIHSVEYHSGHNVGLKNDDTYAGNPIEINLSDNVGRQTDGTPKVDHVSDNVVDSVGQKNVGVDNCIDVEAGNKLSANLVDDVEKENINVGDRIDTDAGDRPIIGDEWSAFSNFNFLKFTPSGNKIGEKNIQYMKDLVENSQEIDWSVVPDSEISKYTQPDKIGEHFIIEKVLGKIDTDLGSTSVALVATEVFVDIGSVVPRRIRKSVAICESPYLSKFDSGCSNVQGQPTKCIDKGPSRKHIFSIKHPFTISITEPFLDMKLLSSFNKFVDKPLRLNSNPIYSESVNNLANAFDFGVVMIKTKEWFYTCRSANDAEKLVEILHDISLNFKYIKASNILLDSRFRAKIANFGLARGYMEPEYLACGQLTKKEDVYSFGVLRLEIVTGRQSNQRNNVVYTVNLVSTNSHTINMKNEVTKLLHIGLLCTQEIPMLRPSMSKALQMLVKKKEELPSPTTPPFIDEKTMELYDLWEKYSLKLGNSSSIAMLSHSSFNPR